MMKNSNLFFVLILGVISWGMGCQAPATQAEVIDIDKLRADFQAMEDAYAASENEKNLVGMDAYYAEDAQSLPNNESTIVGKKAILERLEKNLAADTSGNVIKFEVMEVFASGDLAVEIGKSTITKPDGSISTGKYMSLFEKRDGKYICIRDIWNTDAGEEKEEDTE